MKTQKGNQGIAIAAIFCMIFSQVMPLGWAVVSAKPAVNKAASATPTITIAQANQQPAAVVNAVVPSVQSVSGTKALTVAAAVVQPTTVVTPPVTKVVTITPPAPPSQELVTATINALNRQFTANNMKLKAEYAGAAAGYPGSMSIKVSNIAFGWEAASAVKTFYLKSADGKSFDYVGATDFFDASGTRSQTWQMNSTTFNSLVGVTKLVDMGLDYLSSNYLGGASAKTGSGVTVCAQIMRFKIVFNPFSNTMPSLKYEVPISYPNNSPATRLALFTIQWHALTNGGYWETKKSGFPYVPPTLYK